MKLNDLKPAAGAVKPRWRRGQGPGSGNGKTAGRGSNGQRSRSGATMQAGFEGGQMPIHRRLPKRGFHNPFRKVYSIVNLDRLAEMFPDGGELTIDAARERGLMKHRTAGLKILGDGDIGKSVVVHAHRASAKAKEKIEAAGGRIEIIGAKS